MGWRISRTPPISLPSEYICSHPGSCILIILTSICNNVEDFKPENTMPRSAENKTSFLPKHFSRFPKRMLVAILRTKKPFRSPHVEYTYRNPEAHFFIFQ